MKKIFILLFTFSLLSSCKAQPNPKIWTKKYELGFYNYLDSISKPSMPDTAKRYKYISYIISRLKQEIPNGLNSVTKDSLHNLNIKIGREYALMEYGNGVQENGIVPFYTQWTPLIEKTLRDDFIVIFRKNGIKINDKFCDCIIENLKKTYRDSILVPIPQQMLNNIIIDCKKYPGIN